MFRKFVFHSKILPWVIALTFCWGGGVAKAASRCEDSLAVKPLEETIETCREELTAPVSRDKRVQILLALGKAYAEQGEWMLAVRTWSEGGQYVQPTQDNESSTEKWTLLQILIGQAYAQFSQMSQAKVQLENTADRIDQAIGRHSLVAGLVQNALGDFYVQQNQRQAAEVAYTRARMIHELVFGRLHPKTLGVRLNHAVGLLDLGEEDLALEYFQALLVLLGQQNDRAVAPVKADVLIYLGTLEMRRDHLMLAAQHYQAAFELRQSVFGDRDLKTSQALNNLGVVLYRTGDLVRAEQLLTRAYVIRRDVLGENDALTVSSNKNLQAVIQAQESLKNGLESTLELNKNNMQLKKKRQSHPIGVSLKSGMGW